MEFSQEEYRSLLNVINIRYGLDFSCYEPKSFNRRISRALSVLKLDGLHDLWFKLLKDRDFIFPFINEITVGMTSLFRDPTMWKDLKDLLRKKIKEKESLKICHAGCSTGEEVYSMAILLDQLGIHNQVTSLAVDLNSESIKQASQGYYQKLMWNDFNKNYKEFNPVKDLKSYLISDNPGENEIQFNPKLVKNVVFEQKNILNTKFDVKFDLIFCRNVMIYFDTATKIKLLDFFYESLEENGLLIIGFFDSVSSLIDSTKFELQDAKNKIFRKNI